MFTLQILVAAICYASSTFAMKFSEGLTRPWPTAIIGMLVLTGAVFETLALRYAEVSSTYFIVLGLGAVTTALLAMILFHEDIGWGKLIAIGFIVTGVALLQG